MLLADRHLTYCTSIHPGETWAAVRANLERYVLPVRARVAGGAPFGVGLRVSAEAAATLARPAALAELRAFLADHGLYVFTVNGFPYGHFHGAPVKERVYLPDWRDPARLTYTNQLADVLAALLPEGVEGTVSTLPGAFAPSVGGPGDVAAIARAMAAHAAHLVALEARTGRRVALAVEPEPFCLLETVADAVDFFGRYLFADENVAALARDAGLPAAAAERALRERVGVCYDTCHMAVAFEEPAAALAAFAGAGVRVTKVQVSAGLRLTLEGDPARDAPALAALGAFANDVYLHQVVERGAGGAPARYLDLGEALAAAARAPGRPREWRVHFHVPLFRERFGPFGGTQAHVREALACLTGGAPAAGPSCAHFEVETYSWGVLPAEYRGEDVVTAVTREVEWAAALLR